MFSMTTLPKGVKIGTSQVRQLPRMRIQSQDVEYFIKVFAAEKQKDEPITEDKKTEQKNDEKKSPARKKVKMRKRRTTWMAERVEFPRRSHGKKKGPRNRHLRPRKTKGTGKGMKQKFST